MMDKAGENWGSPATFKSRKHNPENVILNFYLKKSYTIF